MSQTRRLAAILAADVSIARLQAVGNFGAAPKVHALREATYLAGLRKAGMPEE